MKKIIVDFKLDEYEEKQLYEKFAKKEDYDHVIDYDCQVKNKTGKPVLTFVKNYINPFVLKQAFYSMESAATKTDNRGAASGGERKLSKDKNGNLTKIMRTFIPGTDEIMTVDSGVAGYFDRSAHFDFCRTTAFNKNNIEKFNRALPLIETVDRGFKELIPGRYKKQKQMIKATDPNYRISNTAFTTITINKNYRTTYHYDGNDYSLGFGNLVAFCRDIEPMYLVLPRYGVAVHLDTNDLLLVDVHELHGNTEFIPNGPSPMRLSFVMYYRENMWKCLPPKKELERIQMNQRAVAQRYLMGEK
jgi:hypothetical protein|tara:strand:- start:2 stop:910 length:909 start_codon:yes stop_codon:yes gene_type:complete